MINIQNSYRLQYYLCLMFFMTLMILYDVINVVQAKQDETDKHMMKLDGCIVWNAHNTVLGEEALQIHIVPVGYAT